MDEHTEAAHLRAIQPNGIVMVAAALTAVTGLLVGLMGLQLLGLSFRSAALGVVPYAMLALGAAGIALGALLYRMRPGAAPLAVGLMGLAFLGSSAWLIFSFASGLFSLFSMIAPFAAVVATVFALMSIGHCRRAVVARRELFESGMDLGM